MHTMFKWNKDANTNEGVKGTFFSHCCLQCIDLIYDVSLVILPTDYFVDFGRVMPRKWMPQLPASTS